MTRIAGYTPLDRLPLSDVQRRELASLWIESVEELVALQAAMSRRASASVSSGLMTSATQLARDVLPPETYGRMSSPVQPGALGYVIDEKRRLEFQQVVSAGYRSSPPTDLLRSSLPSAVRLMDQMPPVRDQRGRGTCVAFGVLALREFLIGAAEDLSEQFLYWACKEMDGIPHLSGTFVSTGMAALSEAGVCREATWPYSPFPDGDTEGQGPPPHGARDEAKRFVLRSHRGVSQRRVAHYKSVLAGGNGVGGMPIVIGTPVFKSWYESFVFEETGKINMPLPGDEIISGHCWCIVGYVDDESAVGGGYFIVRNSWGTDFARLSPEAPGHAIMPYGFIEMCGDEAFTGPADQSPEADDADDVPEEFKPYVRILDRDSEDLDYALCERGTRVLFNQHDWNSFRVDSDGNRRAFRENDYVWTAAARDRTWFPPIAELDGEATGLIDAARFRRTAFTNAMGRSLAGLHGELYPRLVPAPLWWAFRTRPARIKRASHLLAECSPQLVEFEVTRSGAPSDAQWPQEWLKLLRELVELKVFALDGPGIRNFIVTISAPGLRFARPGRPILDGGTAEALAFAKRVVADWAREHGHRARFTVYVVASSDDDSNPASATLQRDQAVMTVRVDRDGAWSAGVPTAVAQQPGVRRFLEDLAPRAIHDPVQRMKQVIDDLREHQIGGNLTLDSVSRRVGVPTSVARGLAQQLREIGDYFLYRMPSGELAIGTRDLVRTLGVRGVGAEPTLFRRLAVRGALHLPTALGLTLVAIALLRQEGLDPLLAGGSLAVGYGAEWLYGRWWSRRGES